MKSYLEILEDLLKKYERLWSETAEAYEKERNRLLEEYEAQQSLDKRMNSCILENGNRMTQERKELMTEKRAFRERWKSEGRETALKMTAFLKDRITDESEFLDFKQIVGNRLWISGRDISIFPSAVLLRKYLKAENWRSLTRRIEGTPVGGYASPLYKRRR